MYGGLIDHTAIWDGRAMIAWGGLGLYSNPIQGGRYFVGGPGDLDGDGLTVCDGDCNDGSALSFPGAVEVCDGLDQDCNGAVDDGDVDGDRFAVCSDCDDLNPLASARPGEVANLSWSGGTHTLSWESSGASAGDSPAAGAGASATYDIVRGSLGEFPVGSGSSEVCLATGGQRNTAFDFDTPPSGGYWYLVRARRGCPGGYGNDSRTLERVPSACTASRRGDPKD